LPCVSRAAFITRTKLARKGAVLRCERATGGQDQVSCTKARDGCRFSKKSDACRDHPADSWSCTCGRCFDRAPQRVRLLLPYVLIHVESRANRVCGPKPISADC